MHRYTYIYAPVAQKAVDLHPAHSKLRRDSPPSTPPPRREFFSSGNAPRKTSRYPLPWLPSPHLSRPYAPLQLIEILKSQFFSDCIQ